MLFTPVSIVLRSGTGSESTEVEVICKLNVEDAPLLKAAHGETAQASIKMSIMGETMRGYMKALGIGSLTAPGEIQLDFHPIHGCLIQSGTLIPGTEDFSKSYYLYHMCMKLLEGAQREL